MTMTLHAFVNGRRVGVIEYELPKDEHGKEIPLPHPDSESDEVSIVILGPEGQSWDGRATLNRR